MSITFDKNGNLIRDVIKFKPKQDDLTKDIINEITDKYFCSKCDTYHKKKRNGKINQTFIKHFSFRIEVSDSYIYNKKIKRSFKLYDINYHKFTKGSRKQ